MEKELLGFKVSPIALGCDSKPFKTGKDCTELLDGMFSLGINLFDTARGYGHSERQLGRWIKLRGNRDKVFIYTKGCLPMPFSRLNPRCLRRDLNKSLAVLGTHIDLYLLHRDDKKADLKAIFSILNEYVAAGKIKAYGVSNWTADRIKEANRICKEMGLEEIAMVSNNMTAVEWVRDPWGGGDGCVSISLNEKEIDFYRKTNIPMMSYSPLARGFLTGKIKSDDPSTWKKLDGASKRAYLSKENLKVLNRLEALSKKKGLSVAQLSLSYLMSKGINMFPVIGTVNVDRMKDNLKAVEITLSDEEIAVIEEC